LKEEESLLGLIPHKAQFRCATGTNAHSDITEFTKITSDFTPLSVGCEEPYVPFGRIIRPSAIPSILVMITKESLMAIDRRQHGSYVLLLNNEITSLLIKHM
jgi:hypothetical protein